MKWKEIVKRKETEERKAKQTQGNKSDRRTEGRETVTRLREIFEIETVKGTQCRTMETNRTAGRGQVAFQECRSIPKDEQKPLREQTLRSSTRGKGEVGDQGVGRSKRGRPPGTKKGGEQSPS